MFFRLDFLCHAAVHLAGTYVERVSQPSFYWDNGITLQLQLGNTAFHPTATATDSDGGVSDSLDDLAVRCYLLGTSASLASKVIKGPEVKLAARGATGHRGAHRGTAGAGVGNNGRAESPDKNLHDYNDDHRHEHGDGHSGGDADSVDVTIQTLTEEVRNVRHRAQH